MTKAREIELLDALIGNLGDNSYLGPWLKEHRADILADIVNDVSVDAPMPSEARRRGLQIVADAQAEAERIRDKAQEQADALIDTARGVAEDIRAIARRQLETLAGKI